jgi:hypothetical protein
MVGKTLAFILAFSVKVSCHVARTPKLWPRSEMLRKSSSPMLRDSRVSLVVHVPSSPICLNGLRKQAFILSKSFVFCTDLWGLVLGAC